MPFLMSLFTDFITPVLSENYKTKHTIVFN